MKLDADHFRFVLSHFGSGVVVIASRDGDQPIGLAVQSFSSLSLDPPYVLFCPAKTSTTWPAIRKAGHCSVNVLGDQQEPICRQFAQSGGDKFAGIGWEWSPRGNPMLTGSIAHIECLFRDVHDGGDHEIVIAEVESLTVGTDHSPLIFFRGEFRPLHLKLM